MHGPAIGSSVRSIAKPSIQYASQTSPSLAARAGRRECWRRRGDTARSTHGGEGAAAARAPANAARNACGGVRPVRSAPTRGSRTRRPVGPELRGAGVEATQARRVGRCDRGCRGAIRGGSPTTPGRRTGRETNWSTSSASGASRSSAGTPMIAASTSGVKQRPMTAPSRAVGLRFRREPFDAGEDGVLDRRRGTVASRIARPVDPFAPSPNAASNSSMWSGIPSVRVVPQR